MRFLVTLAVLAVTVGVASADIAIPPPKGKKGQVEEIYRALDKGLDELEKSPKKLVDGSNVFAEADSLATKYGISVCATTG